MTLNRMTGPVFLFQFEDNLTEWLKNFSEMKDLGAIMNSIRWMFWKSK